MIFSQHLYSFPLIGSCFNSAVHQFLHLLKCLFVLPANSISLATIDAKRVLIWQWTPKLKFDLVKACLKNQQLYKLAIVGGGYYG